MGLESGRQRVTGEGEVNLDDPKESLVKDPEKHPEPGKPQEEEGAHRRGRHQ